MLFGKAGDHKMPLKTERRTGYGAPFVWWRSEFGPRLVMVSPMALVTLGFRLRLGVSSLMFLGMRLFPQQVERTQDRDVGEAEKQRRF